MMDGIELNDPITPSRAYDFSYLTTDNIERIEVVRGPQSTLYGSDAAGGVINIITRRGEGPFKAAIAGEAGTYQTYSTRAEAGGSAQGFHYSLGASHVSSDGISAAKEKGYTLEGERYRNPERDAYRNSSVSGRLGWAPSSTFDCELLLRYLDSRSDLDNHGGQGGDDPNARQDVKQLFSRVQGRLSLGNGLWEQKIGASLSNQDRDYENDPDADHPTESETASYDARITKFDWQHNLYLHRTNTLTLGLEYEVEKGRSDYYSEAFGFPFQSTLEEKKVTTRSAYLQDQVRLKDFFFCTAGIRLDDHSRFGTEVTWRLAPALLIPATHTKFKGSYGTGFKAPTLYQLYSQYGDRDLNPEESEGWDVGVEQALWGEILSLGATYFHNHFKDLIDFDAGLNRFVNFALVRTKGVELFLLLKPIPDLNIQATYTRTDAEDRKTGLTLIRRPRHKYGLEANYRFLKKGNLNLSYRYVGKRFDNDYNAFPPTRVALSNYALINLAASYDLSSHLHIFGRVENLLDEDYEEISGYGTPGRSVFGGLRLSF
jgi:vitamin B12 transporter